MQGPLAGLPIVVLQSCESLDDAVLWRLDELGGVAVIGSMTPIHSGCGSALLNAAMTSLLYRGGTLGETLRDAENYMFCVEDLKARRGHKERAKGIRVALSFRLWGDPELQVLPDGALGRAAASARPGGVGRRRHACGSTCPSRGFPRPAATNTWPACFPTARLPGC